MDLNEMGEFMLERAENKIVALTIRCLGYTALGLQALLDDVNNKPEAIERWGINKEE